MTPAVVAAGALLVGALLCFFGYGIFKTVVAAAGFMTGALVGAAIGSLVGGHGGLPAVVGALAGGIVLAVLFGALARGAVFLLGAFGGGVVAWAFVGELPLLVRLGGVCLLGLTGGLVALRLERPVISISTAVIGAGAVVVGAAGLASATSLSQWPSAALAGEPQQAWHGWLLVGLWAGLSLCGGVVQLGRARRRG